jgi:hypothetical protein
MGSILKLLGIEMEWHIIYPRAPEFYTVTKTIHNILQGKESVLEPHQLDLLDTVNFDNARIFESVFTDETVGAVFFEDPQVNSMVKAAVHIRQTRCCPW